MTQMEQSTTVTERTRVFIVDDHPIVRQGLTQMINQEADLMVCGESEDAQNALQAVAELHPDLVLLDLSLKGGSGLDLINCLLRDAATGSDEYQGSNACLQRGGDAFLHDFFPLLLGRTKMDRSD